MEEVHTLVAIKSFIKSRWIIAGFFILGFVLLFCIRINAESYDFGLYNDDEYHTVHQGLNLIVNGRVDNFRAQESTRWLVRAFYPYALMHMSTHMGGNVYIEGWEYPGHEYVIKNYIHIQNTPDIFSLDPNLRDLFHTLRVEYVAFVALCIFALLLFFFSKKYYLVAFGGILLLGLNIDLLKEQGIFYIEPGMLASLALLLLVYCYSLYKGDISNKMLLILGFLAAWTISTKFSAVLFAILPLVPLVSISWPDYKKAIKHAGRYLLSIPVLYVLINIPAFLTLQSFNKFLHDFFSNFWQYAAGSDPGITVAPGIHHLGLIVFQFEGLFGYALYVLPVIVIFGLYYASRKEKMILWPLVILVSLSIALLSGQHVYILRNAIPFYLPTLIVALLSLEIVAKKCFSVYGRNRTYVGVAVISLLWFAGIIFHAGGAGTFISRLLPDTKLGIETKLEALYEQTKPGDVWYSVGFSRDFFEDKVYKSIIVTRDGVPSVLNSKNYLELESQYSSMPRGVIVIVAAGGNNKHLTHYILPKYFNTNIQFGKYYIFFGGQK